MLHAEPTVDVIRWFSNLTINDIPLVGGKNASLGELVRELTPKGIRVPNGFALTADAFRTFMAESGLLNEITGIFADFDKSTLADLQAKGQQIRQAILNTPLPQWLGNQILDAYHQLSSSSNGPIAVAVRSSATAEDLPDASFAGQQETYLNVQGEAALIDACRRCYASLFTDRAISYRVDKGFDHLQVALSIGVQQMVRSDLAASGVMFSIDTETGFRDAVLINASYGLGENVVQGSVNPDEFFVFKPTLLAGHRPILRKLLGGKEMKLIYDVGGNKLVKNVPVPSPDRARYSINDDEILTLARWACQIEDHYSTVRGTYTPMDMEWAKDGVSGELYILQARPETVQVRRSQDTIETYRLRRASTPVISGRSVGSKIAQGRVRVVRTAAEMNLLKEGEVLVTDKTDPDWEPIMKKASAIVTNRGGRTCHAAIVSRELGLAAVVGTEHGTEVLSNGQEVTVSCAEGDTGIVYQGLIPFDVETTKLGNLARPRTKIMMNVGNPDDAFALAAIPNDGVGLARIEFIIAHSVKIHPQALLDYDSLNDGTVEQQIATLTQGYSNKSQFFVDRLAEGVGMIAAAFYPKDVIVRLSDFKSNEYAALVGGDRYEPHEENPMIGFRGASRYYNDRFRAAFGLECEAMKRVREDMGLKNVKLMVPFCRTVKEGELVQLEMARHGLNRGQDDLELYVMCEIPSNVICAEEFGAIFDGFSIGSNDLTQLILGVDRDSAIVAHVFDERNPAVKRMISDVIKRCRAMGRKIGICGQAPSDYPEFAEFLVAEGIDSISLNPDTVLKMTARVVEFEQSLQRA